MKDVIVKVPDETVFIHILIGVNDGITMMMQSKTSYNRNGDFNIEFPEEEEQDEECFNQL